MSYYQGIARDLERRFNQESDRDEHGHRSLTLPEHEVYNLTTNLYHHADAVEDADKRATQMEIELRDQLAMAALPGAMREESWHGPNGNEVVAVRAYEIADQMMRVRKPYVDAIEERDRLRDRLLDMRVRNTDGPTERCPDDAPEEKAR